MLSKHCYFLFLFLLLAVIANSQDVFVSGYLRRDGLYIQPHYRTNPNGTLFDNYSTKGNINPYTGKPGWIDPYSKISSTYYTSIPRAYQKNYNNLFDYLTQKDSIRFYQVVNNFQYYYKLFFTALFDLNKNRIEEADKIFSILTSTTTGDAFIEKESKEWLELTSNYLNATEEYKHVYSSLEYEKKGNYEAAIKEAELLKNPLNFYEKYLLKFSFEYKTHKYTEAKISYDSLTQYIPSQTDRDLWMSNREDFFYSLDGRNNYIRALSNETYFYPINLLYRNFLSFFSSYSIPIIELKELSFNYKEELSSENDTTFMRSLVDTSEKNVQKLDFLSFHKHALSNSKDTLKLIKLVFEDQESFTFYQSLLSKNKHTREIENSLVFKLKNATGKEFLLTKYIGLGLIQDKSFDLPHYELYLYCFVSSEGISDISDLFK